MKINTQKPSTPPLATHFDVKAKSSKPDVIHVAHEGVLPEWTTGGGGVYIDSLSRLQAKETDRKIFVIIPYYLQEGMTSIESDAFRYARKVTFDAKLHDPSTGEAYTTPVTYLKTVIQKVHVLAVKPDRKHRDLFTLGPSSTFTSFPEKLASKLNVDMRLNYFDELASQLILSQRSRLFPTKNLVVHTHNYGGASFQLSGASHHTPLVNMIHAKPLDVPLPVHLQEVAPEGELLKERALKNHSIITASTPHAFLHLSKQARYYPAIRGLSNRGGLATVRPSIDMETKFNMKQVAKCISDENKARFESGNILEKKRVCLEELHEKLKLHKNNWDISPNKPTVLFIGRLCAAKGMNHLESVIQRCKHQNVNVAIMGLPSGAPDSQQFVQKMKTTYPEVPFLSTVSLQSQFGPLLRVAADIGLLLSKEEEFGLVLPEYQVMGGAHCIYSNVGGTSYAIAQEEEPIKRLPDPKNLNFKVIECEGAEVESDASATDLHEAKVAPATPLPPRITASNAKLHAHVDTSEAAEHPPLAPIRKSKAPPPPLPPIDTKTASLPHPSAPLTTPLPFPQKEPIEYKHVKPKPDPECGTSFEYSDDKEEMEENILAKLNEAIERLKSCSDEERLELHESIISKATKDFHPSSWLERVESVYQSAITRQEQRRHMRTKVLPELKAVIRERSKENSPVSAANIPIEAADEPELKEELSSGTLRTAIDDAIQVVRTKWTSYTQLLVDSLLVESNHSRRDCLSPMFDEGLRFTPHQTTVVT